MQRIRGSGNSLGPSLPVSRLAIRLVCAALGIALSPAGRANTVEFATGAHLLGGFAENASASFDINNTAHTITVHLLNLILDPTDVDQAIGSLRFTIAGAGTPTPTMGTRPASDTRLGISSTGTPTNVTAETSTIWKTSAVTQGSGEQIALCTVCASGGNSRLIIGGPKASTLTYSAADSTLKPSSSGQWIIGSGLTYASGSLKNVDTSPDWVIKFATGTDLSHVVIANVIFGFGESANYGWGSMPGAEETPEPGSLILFGTGIGLLVIAAGARRLRRR
jgi:hypothetical protein